MASTLHSTPNKQRSNMPNTVKRRVITSTWFIMTLLIGALTLAVWMFSSSPAFEKKAEAIKEPTVEETVLNIGQIDHIDSIKQLEDAVKPISFDVLVKDLRDYPPEFKDFKYLEENKGKWTVQVMDVSEHEVVTDYLSSRKDRNKFAYFRYRDSDNQARYLLTYGIMASPQMAMGAAKTIDFTLPANVRVLPEEINRYLDLIENYELSTGVVKDLSGVAKKVDLQPTESELAAKQDDENEAEPVDGSENGENANDSEAGSQEPPTDEDGANTSEAEADPNNVSNAGNDSQSKATTDAVESEIKGSTDTSDTLSVIQETEVVEPVEEDTAQPVPPKKPKTPSSQPNSVVSPTAEQPPIPVKPKETTSIQTTNDDTDTIKELIESTN